MGVLCLLVAHIGANSRWNFNTSNPTIEEVVGGRKQYGANDSYFEVRYRKAESASPHTFLAFARPRHVRWLGGNARYAHTSFLAYWMSQSGTARL